MTGRWRKVAAPLLAAALFGAALLPDAGTSGGAGKAHAAGSDLKLSMRPPVRVDLDRLPIAFDYASARADKLRVKLEFKRQGEKSYRAATVTTALPLAASAGTKPYAIEWDKAADRVGAGDTVDLRLSVTDGRGNRTSYDMRGYRPLTKQALRDGIDDYLIYYGAWNDTLVETVKTKYDLVIADARGLSAAQAAKLRAGRDPHDARDDVLVVGYVSVGEDLRTNGLTPEQMRKDPRFVQDGSGPSVDPREGAPYPDGGPLTPSIDVKGKPTGGGFAPYYLNDNFAANGTGEAGTPDFNRNFNGAFVNPGHPLWYETLLDMKLSRDNVPGVKELLGTTFGAGFGLDGLFLDTLDTAAPNSYTNAESWNQSEFEWTAVGTQRMVKKLADQFPGHLLVGNRGLFFYHPDLPMYEFSLRPHVDFVLYESFRLDSSAGAYYNESFFNDNKYNFAQKLLAEADRPDGFRTLSLGYAEGPGGDVLKRALQAKPNGADQRMLQQDVREAAALGMVHYISDAGLTNVNTYAKDRAKASGKAPVWGSTQSPSVWGQPYEQPRTGVGQAFFRGRDLVVRWDVAHAEARPVTYTLYVKEDESFDFASDLRQQSDLVIDPLVPAVPENYAGGGDWSGRYPYEAAVKGLDPRKSYTVLVRAKDAKGVYETNRVTLQTKQADNANKAGTA